MINGSIKINNLLDKQNLKLTITIDANNKKLIISANKEERTLNTNNMIVLSNKPIVIIEIELTKNISRLLKLVGL